MGFIKAFWENTPARGLAVCLLGTLIGCTAQPPEPPETQVRVVTDTLHGNIIEDPYRWLEDQQAPETRAWIDSQNAHTQAHLEYFPGKEKIRARFTELLKIEKMAKPVERNGRYFFEKRLADQELYVIYMRDGLDGEDRALIDPHPLSEDLTTSAGIEDVSNDGALMAYYLRYGGEDEIEIHLLNVETGEELPDVLERATYSGFNIAADKNSCFYTRFGSAGPRTYHHTFGTDFSQDRLLYGEQYGGDKYIGSELSEDGKWLDLTVYFGSSGTKNDVYFMNAASGGPIQLLVNDLDANFYGQIAGDEMYLMTNWNAPNWRIMAADLNRPGRDNWREVIPNGEHPIQQFSMVGGRIFVEYLENVVSRIRMFEPDGKEVGDLELPSIGSAKPPEGRWSGGEGFYTFESYHIPPTIFRYDVQSGEQTEWWRSGIDFNSDSAEVTQVWFESRDGTRVPMFLTHRKGIELDGNNPTYMWGYGGFNNSEKPIFASTFAFWIESGGIVAVPSLRGGGEFGDEWHRAAMFEKKQNTYDDCIAAAEWLVDHKYTRPEKLAVAGGSNGGLLVGAVMVQRPDLFQAVYCSYPLLDMIRYHKLLMGPFWISEYGSADSADQFDYIYAYSPYHNVKEGVDYPAILLTTGDADTRVDPMHARKMTALLQAKSAPGTPVLLYYDTKAGHSGGKPISGYVEDMIVRFGFLFWQLGVEP